MQTGFIVGFIYGIRNKHNNRWYVGQTRRSCQERWDEHREVLVAGKHNKKLQKDFNEFGMEAFEWVVLEAVALVPLVEASELLTRREMSWCDKKRGKKEGYNVLIPGQNHSKWKRKIERWASGQQQPAKKKSKKAVGGSKAKKPTSRKGGKSGLSVSSADMKQMWKKAGKDFGM